MYKELLAKIPKRFKIIPQDKALKWFNDREKWDTLELPYKIVVLRSLCFWDIGFFSQKITQKWTTGKKTGQRFGTPEFHREMWGYTLKEDDSVTIVPRGFAKTTAVSRIEALWLLLFEIEPSILLISSKGLGEEVIGDIKRELEENEFIRLIWGELVPADNRKDDKTRKWRQTELQLLTGVEMKTLTKGQSVRGRRPTLVIIDDPEENKDVKNPRIADEFFNWVFTALYNALDDGGKMIVLGTILSENCFVNRLKNEADSRNFAVIEYPAIIDFDYEEWKNSKDWDKATKNARSLWPEKWTLEKLRVKLQKVTEKPFFQEFMNVPFVVNSTPVFTNALCEVVEPIRVEGNWNIYKEKEGIDLFLGIDIANGSSGGDYSVVVVRDSQMELVAQFRGKVAQDVLAIEVDRFLEGTKDCFIVPENNIGLAFINAAKQYDWAMKMYKKKVYDSVTMKESDVIGWNTNAKTKILMITEYHKILREGLQVSPEINMEISKYYYDDKGGMNAIAPYHDDTVIADALCLQAVKSGVSAPMLAVF